ncbi:MAG: hypothetical protein OYK82_06625 [Gammaproteobacteria bacterium]|nr:hypothetical protein [Gammaproteobacteria bacterium]
MRRVRTPALVAPALFAATALAGQTTADECDMESFRTLSSRETVIGQRVTWVGSPEVACTDGVRIRADSAVVWEADERTEFYGGFRYLDSERELEADTADYFQREGRLLARGNAELRTLDGATVVRGDTLDLYEGTGGSGQERLEASGRRALALIAPADSSAGAEAAPYEVLADRLRFEGERFLFAEGNVAVERDSLYAAARSLSFDRELGTLVLLEEARVESGATETIGQRITLELPEGEITTMEAEEKAALLSGDLDLSGGWIEVEFDSGSVSYITVTEGDSSDGEGVPEQAAAFAQGLFLTGNSIEVDAPGGVLASVRAEGAARGESLGPEGERPPRPETSPGGDTGGDALPEGAEEAEEEAEADQLLGILDHDWIEGDAVVGSFDSLDPPPEAGEAPPAEEAQYVLTQLHAEGNARTLYRSPPEAAGAEEAGSTPDEPPPERSEWGISYLVANEIRLLFAGGQVEEVIAVGGVSGLQLEPEATFGAGGDESSPGDAAEEPGAPSTEPGP